MMIVKGGIVVAILAVIKNYLCQPLVWLSLIWILGMYFIRVKKERQQFRIAVNSDCYEGRHFLKDSLAFFFTAGIFTVLCGIGLPMKVIYLYQILAGLSLIFFAACDLSFLALIGTGIIMLLAPKGWLWADKLPAGFTTMMLLLASLTAFLQAAVATKSKAIFFTPTIKEGKRGRRIVSYSWRNLALIPLILLVPTGKNGGIPLFWILNGSSQHFTIVLMPLLILTYLTTTKLKPKALLAYYQKRKNQLAFLEAVLAFLALFIPQNYGLVLLGLSFLAELLLQYSCYNYNRKGHFWYVETSRGVRVVAVKADTPAAKMQLEAGDIILECNKKPVANASELYQALQENAAYCKLLVQNVDGELKICESAIYADAPHEIGLILFD